LINKYSELCDLGASVVKKGIPISHHEGREGHENRIMEKRRIFKKSFSSFVLFVCFVVMTVSPNSANSVSLR
jgi:hypothetical protein